MMLRGISFARIAKTTVVLAIAFYGILAATLYLLQDRILFYPDPAPLASCSALSGVEAIEAGDLRGYFHPSGSSTRIVVFYHGNAGRACESAAHFRSSMEIGDAAWLAVEYPGYAGDLATPTVAGLERAGTAAARWIAERGYEEVDILAMSIGGCAAAAHARTTLPDRAFLAATFDSLSATAGMHYPMFPARLLLKRDCDVAGAFAPVPQVVVAHGTADATVPFVRGVMLAEKIGPTSRLIPIEGAGHESIWNDSALFSAMNEFFTFSAADGQNARSE
ncbi:MAG TPA: alpha/beta hydrolase [Candidatus Paceibacterota bacterium]|nr:alpha/beta hydrolase [Candidatus Paceibacterota bacterium]